jgi:hypothetical protein
VLWQAVRVNPQHRADATSAVPAARLRRTPSEVLPPAGMRGTFPSSGVKETVRHPLPVSAR